MASCVRTAYVTGMSGLSDRDRDLLRRFGDDYAYGVKSGDRSGMENFDVVARYARQDPAELEAATEDEAAPAADD